MKLTKAELRQMIKEELLNENDITKLNNPKLEAFLTRLGGDFTESAREFNMEFKGGWMGNTTLKTIEKLSKGKFTGISAHKAGVIMVNFKK